MSQPPSGAGQPKMWDGQSLLVGQVKGVPVGLHFTLLILAFFQWIGFMVAYGPVWFFTGFFTTYLHRIVL